MTPLRRTGLQPVPLARGEIMFRPICLALVIIVYLAWPPPSRQEKTNTVELNFGNFADLEDFWKKNKGKVIVIYFWGQYSAPDKYIFAELVKIKKKYAGQGLVTASVILDYSLELDNSKKRVLKFLEKQKASFPNILLVDEFETFQKKLSIIGPPCFLLFNRQGKKSHLSPYEDENWEHEKVEKKVIELLAEK
jgi:thiol-disulfide isomerase/thioredoxin